MKKKWFYERNDELINHPLNKRFEEILWMSTKDFKQWCIDFRKLVVYLWDEKGIPPRVGFSEDGMIDNFNGLIGHSEKEIVNKDELTGKNDVLRNTVIFGNATNQFFPTMMKTRINYSNNNDDGKSIYDYFAKDELLDTFITYASRHFKRDSFYAYSNPVKEHDTENHLLWPCTKFGIDFIERFEKHFRAYNDYDYWLSPTNEDKEYTGYNEELKNKKYLNIHKNDIELLVDIIPKKCMTNLDYNKSEIYQIKVFKLGQRLFPVGLKAFRISYCQYATNYPAAIAKFIYNKYTEEFKNEKEVIVWDPSAGWGGRITGAMLAKDDRNILYLGTDPNTDHNTENGRTKYHELADFINERTLRGQSFFPQINKYKIWQKGSEDMQFDKDFQKYKGKISLIFTSPPYFAKEAYSEDEEQSYKKFTTYDKWKNGFLKPTLETAYNWLRPGGYLVWNIADVKFGKDMLPLEKDSCDIIESLGFKFVQKWKMVLSSMPGANRTDEDGNALAKNFCKIRDRGKKNKVLTMKYEPIWIYSK